MADPRSIPLARAVEESKPMDLLKYPGLGLILVAVFVTPGSDPKGHLDPAGRDKGSAGQQVEELAL